MGIFSDRCGSLQQWGGFKSQCEHLNGDSITERRQWRCNRNRSSNKFLRRLGFQQPRELHDNNTRCSVSIHADLPRTWYDKPNNNPKSDHYTKRHRHNKYIYAVTATVISVINPVAALAEGVGGVSATANPIANSSGSVTNQAIQVLQGPYVTNTYGGGVSCQGTTMNVTPYVQFADSRKHPWEDYYMEPQYNMSDFEGRTVKQTVTVKNYPWETWYDDRTKDDGTRWFEDGDDIQIEIDVPTADGVPDQVSNGTLDPIWHKPVRTDMRANQSFNLGLSATLSIPLNRGMQRKCAEAAQAQIDNMTQLTANKRLDFEIARLKNCGELKKAGIFFHPKSPYHAICADVVVTAPGGQIMPHTHTLPQPQWKNPNATSSSSEVNPSSLGTDQSSSPSGTDGGDSSQASSELSQSPSSQQVSLPSIVNQQEVSLTVPKSWPRLLSLP